MVKIPTYERQVSVPATTGMAAAPMAMAETGVDKGLAKVSAELSDAALRIQRRSDYINTALAEESFASKANEYYLSAKDTNDIRDPNFLTKFNTDLRAEKEKALAGFSGGGDARAMLSGKLEDTFGRFSRTMLSDVHTAQKEFIFETNRKAISPLISKVYDNPADLSSVLDQAAKIVDESRDVMTPTETSRQLAAAQDMIFGSHLDGLVDRGLYKQAQEAIDKNPTIISSMPPEKQRGYLRAIANGLNEKQRIKDEVNNQVMAIQSVASSLGVKVAPSQIFASVTGISPPAASPATKVAQAWGEMKKIMPNAPENPPPQFIAQVGFGVDAEKLGFGGKPVDPNQMFGSDGMLTVKGIGEKIKDPIESATAVRTYYDKFDGAVKLFKEKKNNQALISAATSFLKALDDGAVVRKEDHEMVAAAAGVSAQVKGMLDKFEGQIMPMEVVNQMDATMRSFTIASMMSSKAAIDPYLADADSRGFRRLDVGLPISTYNKIFAGIPDPNAPTGKSQRQELLSTPQPMPPDPGKGGQAVQQPLGTQPGRPKVRMNFSDLQ
jgi:hypothetical protein